VVVVLTITIYITLSYEKLLVVKGRRTTSLFLN